MEQQEIPELDPYIYLCLLVGIPASGKSTFCQEIITAAQSSSPSLKIIQIEYDKIEDEISSEFEPEKWKETRSIAFGNISSLLEQKVSIPTIILVDDNFYYKSMRKEFYKLVIQANKNLEDTIRYTEIFIDTPVETALERNQIRERSVPDTTIIRINKIIEPAYSYCYNARFSSLPDFIEYLHTLPVPPCLEEQEKIPMTQSEAHELDLKLRKVVGSILKSHKLPKSAIKALTQLKKVFLKEVAAGSDKTEQDFRNEVQNLIDLHKSS
ncbi:unnamed protein product [Moneuplotes crassus]|uniref:L-seryl-tRNA(Sec) kinase n=1 Tax=Euplotes crassus TaxID=5936 RepID=A0AAD1XLN9_EUPCR|nr:unnamed protein product [Moneuplotes crassus]